VRAWRWVGVLLLAGLAVAFAAFAAYALPLDTSRTGLACASCHSAVPWLNARGIRIAQLGLRAETVHETSGRALPLSVLQEAGWERGRPESHEIGDSEDFRSPRGLLRLCSDGPVAGTSSIDFAPRCRATKTGRDWIAPSFDSRAQASAEPSESSMPRCRFSATADSPPAPKASRRWCVTGRGIEIDDGLGEWTSLSAASRASAIFSKRRFAISTGSATPTSA